MKYYPRRPFLVIDSSVWRVIRCWNILPERFYFPGKISQWYSPYSYQIVRFYGIIRIKNFVFLGMLGLVYVVSDAWGPFCRSLIFHWLQYKRREEMVGFSSGTWIETKSSFVCVCVRVPCNISEHLLNLHTPFSFINAELKCRSIKPRCKSSLFSAFSFSLFLDGKFPQFAARLRVRA